MNTALRVALFASLLGVAAAYAADGVTRINDRGRDGDTYYYEVSCDDGSRGSILVVDSDPPKTCAQSTTLSPICKPEWTLREAAQRICK